MSASAMSNKIDKVEHQCKELILEINQHLSMEVNENKNILLRDQHQYVRKKNEYAPVKENKFKEAVFSSLKQLDCHHKIISLSNNPKVVNNFKGTLIGVPVPKYVCENIFHINQLLTDDKKDMMKNVDTACQTQVRSRRLEIQHLNHVNIQPKLNIQKAFELSLCDKTKNKKTNVAVHQYRHCSAKEMRHEKIKDNFVRPMDVNNACNKRSLSNNADEGKSRTVFLAEIEKFPSEFEKDELLQETNGTLDQLYRKVQKGTASKTNDVRSYLFGDVNTERKLRMPCGENAHLSLLTQESDIHLFDNAPGESMNISTKEENTTKNSKILTETIENLKEPETSSLQITDNKSLILIKTMANDDCLFKKKENNNEVNIPKITNDKEICSLDYECSSKNDETVYSLNILSETKSEISEISVQEKTFRMDLVNTVHREGNFRSDIKRNSNTTTLDKEQLISSVSNLPRMYDSMSEFKNKTNLETLHEIDKTIHASYGTEDDVLKITPRRIARNFSQRKDNNDVDEETLVYRPLIERQLLQKRMKMTLNEQNRSSSKARIDEDVKYIKLVLNIINDCSSNTNVQVQSIAPNENELTYIEQLESLRLLKPNFKQDLSITNETFRKENQKSISQIVDDNGEYALYLNKQTSDDNRNLLITDELSSVDELKSTYNVWSSKLLHSESSTCNMLSSGEISDDSLSPGQIIISSETWKRNSGSIVFTSDFSSSEKET